MVFLKFMLNLLIVLGLCVVTIFLWTLSPLLFVCVCVAGLITIFQYKIGR